MNTNALKRFAQQTRNLLLEQVAARLRQVLDTDSVELRERAPQVRALREVLKTTTAAELVDKVAYTWFNRLVALRFLDVNDYQPLGVRIVSGAAGTEEAHPLPEVLEQAQRGIISAELLADQRRVRALLSGELPSQLPDDEVYRELLVGACNSLHTLFPFLFEPLQDHTELLLPTDLTTRYSVISKVRGELRAEDCQHVEVLGWLYQFYISDKKDEVFAAKTKVKKEDIPAATQLFTPRWIVEYLVQNTVGKLWLQHHPTSGLRALMPYYLESASATAPDPLPLAGPEALTVLDPACGSGHMLLYAFELLAHIYEEEGYAKADIAGLILTHNLRGLELDERAAQLAGFALMMKARSYHRAALRQQLQPRITWLQPLALPNETGLTVLAGLGEKGNLHLWHDLGDLRRLDNIGSLLVPRTPASELQRLHALLATPAPAGTDMFAAAGREQLRAGLATLLKLSQQYACVVANPPYMGSGNMNAELSAFVRTNYPDSKADLMACFMESSLKMLLPKGFLGMINQHSWMFISSYEGLREKMIESIFIDTLLHLGPRTFPEIGGEVVQNAAFTFYKTELPKDKGVYIRLVSYETSEEKRQKTLLSANELESAIIFRVNQKEYEKIPGNTIGYWLTNRQVEIFEQLPSLSSIYEIKAGMATGNNEKFVRLWHELNSQSISYNSANKEAVWEEKFKWVGFNKGGSYRKWYGNNEYVVRFDKTGYNQLKSSGNNCPSEGYYFLPSLTWSDVSSNTLNVRVVPQGSVFSTVGNSIFYGKKDYYGLIAYLNSGYVGEVVSVINPTLHANPGDLAKIPVSKELLEGLSSYGTRAVEISKIDWSRREQSFDFKSAPIGNQNLVAKMIEDECNGLSAKISEIATIELDINKLISSSLNIEYDLTPKSEELSIAQDEINHIELESSSTGIVTTVDFDKKVMMAQFLSYAVGCLFGRYSLDQDGLILANQGETLADYLRKIGKSETEARLLPDADNIIPVLDQEWFEDDLVAGFTRFLRAAFGPATLAQNLAYVEECLGKPLREYFTKDFYADHVRRYSKRPIYWQLASPTRAFSVLIYLHRYTPDTLNLVLARYLRPLQSKVQERIERQKHIQVSAEAGAAERTKALREQEKLERQLRELQAYERDTLLPLANARIALDLDEGVLVNYNKLGAAVREVAGLNDAKAKAKVRKFDWIDAGQIR